VADPGATALSSVLVPCRFDRAPAEHVTKPVMPPMDLLHAVASSSGGVWYGCRAGKLKGGPRRGTAYVLKLVARRARRGADDLPTRRIFELLHARTVLCVRRSIRGVWIRSSKGRRRSVRCRRPIGDLLNTNHGALLLATGVTCDQRMSIHDELPVLMDLDQAGTSIVCHGCRRAWHIPDRWLAQETLGLDNVGYLQEHARDHRPPIKQSVKVVYQRLDLPTQGSE
jgi:hypothetical protein